MKKVTLCVLLSIFFSQITTTVAKADNQTIEAKSIVGNPAKAHAVVVKTSGIASYYGRQFHGKKTASGEIFSKWKMTAAHKTLPLGTIVRITCLDCNLVSGNQPSVIVKINDRGPYVKGRILDLSLGAMAKLNSSLVKLGTARVKIEIIS